MSRIMSAEGFLIFLLVGLHLFIFTRGMDEEGWGSLSNTVSILEDRDLNLANNRFPSQEGPSAPVETAVPAEVAPETEPHEGPAAGEPVPPPEHIEVPPAAPEGQSEDAPAAMPAAEEETPTPTGPYGASPANAERIVARTPLGTSFFDIPFVWAANRWFIPEAKQDDDQETVHAKKAAKESTDVFALLLSRSFWTVLAMLVLYAVLTDLEFPRGDSLMSVLFIFASSSLTWYGASSSSYGVATFVFALILYAFTHLLLKIKQEAGYEYYGRWFGIGLLVGLAGLVEYGSVWLAAVFVLYLLLDRTGWGTAILKIIVFALGFGAVWWINPCYWSTQFGTGVFSALRETFQLAGWHLAPVRVLFHLRNGFFLFAPLYFFGFFGLLLYLMNRSEAPVEFRLGGVSLLSLLALSFAAGLNVRWTQGGFGQHLLTPALVFVAIGVGELLGAEDKRFLRYLLGFAATVWSYLVFLLARSGILGDSAYGLADVRPYWKAIWGKDYTWKWILNRVGNCSATMNYMLAEERRGVFLVFIVAAFLLLLPAFSFVREHRLREQLERKARRDAADKWRAPGWQR
ncbi:MAG: hypothetical protein V2A58_04450 [Planctomycetota bacterium]